MRLTTPLCIAQILETDHCTPPQFFFGYTTACCIHLSLVTTLLHREETLSMPSVKWRLRSCLTCTLPCLPQGRRRASPARPCREEGSTVG